LNPASEACGSSKVVDNGRGGFSEEIHAHTKKKSINDPRDNDPFPKFMSNNKTMGLEIGLDGYYDFLEQDINLSKYKELNVLGAW